MMPYATDSPSPTPLSPASAAVEIMFIKTCWSWSDDQVNPVFRGVKGMIISDGFHPKDPGSLYPRAIRFRISDDEDPGVHTVIPKIKGRFLKDLLTERAPAYDPYVGKSRNFFSRGHSGCSI